MASIACRFCNPDAEVVGGLRQGSCLVAGMPVRLGPSPRRDVETPRLLILTNYVHRDFAQGTRAPLACFQTEVLRLIEPLRATVGPVEVRWRPHPADDQTLVDRGFGELRDVELSRGVRSLEEDIRWADAVVATPSTTVLESLLAQVPVFLHLLPEFRDGPNARALDPERRFFRAEEGVARIAPVLEGLRRGDDVTAPERRALERLFGPGGKPVPFGAVLRRERLLAPVYVS
jgi:hypothetical protein